MCALDSHAAEDHGIALNNSNRSSDTCFPINVDDTKLSPNMWTAMSFSLIMIEASHMLKQFYRTLAASLSTATSKPLRD